MSAKNLPCITSVQFIKAEDLELHPKQYLTPGVATSAIGYFYQLQLCVPASLTVNDQDTPSGIEYTTTVQGELSDNDEETIQHTLMSGFFVFKIQDAHKSSYLIGTKEKPFPNIKFGKTIEQKPDGRRVVPFEINWVSTLPPVPVVLL